jgi:hypothetical protein
VVGARRHFRKAIRAHVPGAHQRLAAPLHQGRTRDCVTVAVYYDLTHGFIVYRGS